MESQDNAQLGPPIHDEITIENSDSDHEAENVKYENEKNANIIKSYENSPKLNQLNVSNDPNRSNMFKVNQSTLPRPKHTEWDVVTHVKLSQDLKVPPLPVNFKEYSSPNLFHHLPKTEQERKKIFNEMLTVYNAWRKQYNDVHGFRSVDDNIDGPDQCVPNRQGEDNDIDAIEMNEDEKIREKTPDINDDNDFPTLGGRASSSRSASIVSKTSKQVVDVDIDEFEEKDDPDDQDFIPSSQRRKKNNKKTVYKKPSGNIFDFDENATAWQSSKEVSASANKKFESKSTKVVQEPVVTEEKIDCPICSKPFPISEIENHASDCLSFEDAVPPLSSRTRTPSRNPPPLDNIEDAILISDDEVISSSTESTSNLPAIEQRQQVPKPNIKRLITDQDTDLSSPTKKLRSSPKP
ncbi:hypothetical protein M8J76_011408 [Diaphorina citri]|nr:hypothetical protein M8J76_011408 [Diaphorina citri]